MRERGLTTVSMGTASDVTCAGAGRPVDELRIGRTVVADDECGRDRVVALSPHRRPDRHDLADDRLGRESSAGHDGGDVIDPDPTDHFPPLLHAVSSERFIACARLFAPYTHRSALPNQAEVKQYGDQPCSATKCQ